MVKSVTDVRIMMWLEEKMRLPALRGAILEELVLHLLAMVGYRVADSSAPGTRDGRSGLEVRGRGEWHQIDALAEFDHTPAFMYPLRLLVEAKCYARSRPVGIDVVRNAVGVVKDISENFFTYRNVENNEIQYKRYNYSCSIFSTSGFTRGAERYAIAHQIFLIQYKNVSLLRPVVDGLLSLNSSHFSQFVRSSDNYLRLARDAIRVSVDGGNFLRSDSFSDEGNIFFRDNIINPLLSIRGSYFGMLQGKWPIHFISRHPLPVRIFLDSDVVRCRIYGRISSHWSFVPIDGREGDEDWFRLEFDLPYEVALLVKDAAGDKFAIARIKQDNFSFVSLSGFIGSVRRQVRLELDQDWIEHYLSTL